MNLCTTGAVFLVAGPVEGGVYDLDRQADHVISDTVSYLPSALAGGDDLDGDGFPVLAVGNDQVDTVFVLFGGGLY